MTKALLIAHGKSNTAKIVQQRCIELAQEQGIALDYVFTSGPGHAEILAAGAASFDWVIVCGGDGLNHEVVNGLMAITKGQRPLLSTIPGGSGNDFNRIFRSRTVESVFTNWTEGRKRDIALIKIQYKDTSRYALNMSTVGIGAAIAKTVNQRKYKLPASMNYYFAILQWLIRYKSPMVEIKMEDTGEVIPATSIFLAAIGNGKYAGNGLGLCPQASIYDYFLGLTTIGKVGVVDFLRYQNTLKSGKQIIDLRVSYKKQTDISFKVIHGIAHVEADGELICSLAQGEHIRYEKAANALAFI